MRPYWYTALFLMTTVCGCQLDPCTSSQAGPGVHLECPMPGWVDRAYDLYIPQGWDGSSPLPLIVVFHGGGGNKRAALRTTCPGGDTKSPDCFAPLSTALGYAVVFPDGTGTRPLWNVRTWNAGGGTDGTTCVSGGACKSGVDDMAYLDDLLADVGEVIPIDPGHIHATGLSNGGAISHRWACERPQIVASIAPVGGTNQFAAVGGPCATSTPVLQIHGTEDPCWTYETSDQFCLDDDNHGVKTGVPESMEGWRIRNNCDDQVTEELLPDLDPDDGARVTRVEWQQCESDTTLLRVEGGGHTWPGGYAYLDASTIGPMCRDINASQLILEFFDAHPKN